MIAPKATNVPADAPEASLSKLRLKDRSPPPTAPELKTTQKAATYVPFDAGSG